MDSAKLRQRVRQQSGEREVQPHQRGSRAVPGSPEAPTADRDKHRGSRRHSKGQAEQRQGTDATPHVSRADRSPKRRRSERAATRSPSSRAGSPRTKRSRNKARSPSAGSPSRSRAPSPCPSGAEPRVKKPRRKRKSKSKSRGGSTRNDAVESDSSSGGEGRDFDYADRGYRKKLLESCQLDDDGSYRVIYEHICPYCLEGAWAERRDVLKHIYKVHKEELSTEVGSSADPRIVAQRRFELLNRGGTRVACYRRLRRHFNWLNPFLESRHEEDRLDASIEALISELNCVIGDETRFTLSRLNDIRAAREKAQLHLKVHCQEPDRRLDFLDYFFL